MSDLRREGSEIAATVVDRLMAELDGDADGGSSVQRTLARYAELFERTFEAYAGAIDRVLGSTDGPGAEPVALRGAPGRQAAAEVWVHNSTAARVATGGLRITDLTGPDGARIVAALAAFEPATLVVGPATSASSVLALRIPSEALAGDYHGHVLAGALDASVPVRLVVE